MKPSNYRFSCRFGLPLGIRQGGVVLTACPELEELEVGGWYPECAGPRGSVEFRNVGKTPLYAALMRADKSGALGCHRDNSPLGFESDIFPRPIPPFDPNSKEFDMSKLKLGYCRGGSGDLYLVWWPTNQKQPTSISAARPRLISVSFNPFRGTVKIQE